MLLSRLITGDPMGPQIARGGGGGGGQTSVAQTGVPDWAVPYVKGGLRDASEAYEAGALSEVADLTPEQLETLGRRSELGQRGGVLDALAQDSYSSAQAYRDAAAGQGLFGSDAILAQTNALTAGGEENPVTQAVQQAVGNQLGAQALGGALGSARAGAQTQKAGFDAASAVAANELAQRRQAALSGAQGVIGSGGEIGRQFQSGVNLAGSVGDALQQQKQNELDATHQGLGRFFGYLGSPALGQSSTTTTSGGGK